MRNFKRSMQKCFSFFKEYRIISYNRKEAKTPVFAKLILGESGNMRKSKMKRLVCTLLMAVFAVSLALPVCAETMEVEIPELNMTIQLPDDMYVFTQDLDITDPKVSEAGITDVYETKKFYQDNNIYLNAVAKDQSYQVIVSKKENDSTREIYDFTIAEDEQIQSLITEMETSFEQGEGIDSYELSRYDTNGRPYIKMLLNITDQEGKKHELNYTTIVNGYSVVVDTYGEGELTQAQEELVKSIVDTAEYTLVEKPETIEMAPVAAFLVVAGPILLIVLMILIPSLYSRHKQKEQKKRRAIMGERLIAYRKEQQAKEEAARQAGVPLEQPPILFQNVTEFTDDAIKEFCYFHCVRRKIVSQVFFFLVGIVCCIVCFVAGGSEWFTRVLLFALGVFCIVYPFYAPYKMTRNSQNSYRKYPSRVAHYYFRSEDFRLSGIQSSTVYPYFQVAKAYETKNYFYLYFGEEQAYYVKKSEFIKGDPAEFRKFLKEKLGKEFK